MKKNVKNRFFNIVFDHFWLKLLSFALAVITVIVILL